MNRSNLLLLRLICATFLILICQSGHAGVMDSIRNFFRGWNGPSLLAVSGSVTLKSKGSNNNARLITKGAVPLAISNGDILFVGSKSLATTACSDGSLQKLRPGRHTINCADDKLGSSIIGDLNAARGKSDSPLQLQWPQATLLLSDRPSFKWNPVDEKGSYILFLYADDQLLWRGETYETNLDFPNQLRSLRYGESYRLQIIRGRLNSDEQLDLEPFALINPKAASEVQEAVRKIDRNDLDASHQLWMKAALLANNGLNAEALQLLTEIPSEQRTMPNLRMEGDLWHKIGLNREALERYEMALHIIEQDNSLGGGESEAWLRLQIGRIVGIKELEQLKLAEKIYKELGMETHARQAQAEIELLTPAN